MLLKDKSQDRVTNKSLEMRKWPELGWVGGFMEERGLEGSLDLDCICDCGFHEMR